ncbi:MAG: group II intron maturase-specific domain-containing protein [Desulfosalsimonas sp.]
MRRGGVISPLLANLYLHLLDRIWYRRDLANRYDARIVKYADDLVILCKGSVERPLQMLKAVLEKCDLRLNEKMTRIVNSYEESFDFLGFSFQMRRSHKSGKYYPHTEPSKRPIERKDRIKEITHRRRTPVPLPLLVMEMNQATRGWSGYFHYGHSTKVMSRVKRFTEERMRRQLCERYKVRTRSKGYSRFTTEFLYRKLGLFKIPTNAKWRQAKARQ